MRRHVIFVGAGVLFASGFGRKNCALHQHFTVANDVLPADFGNHPIHFTGITIVGQVSPLYDVPGRAECAGYDFYTEHTLPQTEYA